MTALPAKFTRLLRDAVAPSLQRAADAAESRVVMAVLVAAWRAQQEHRDVH